MASPKIDPALDFALREADNGAPVFPVGRDKIPLIKGWPELATTDQDQIRLFEKQFPGRNWGAVTGARANRLIIEVDPRHGGDETIRRLEDQFGPLPETRMYRSGSGGDHYVFAWPESQHITNAAGKIGQHDAPGVDVRGHNGFGVLPGSLHKNGKRYELTNDIMPQQLPPRWSAALSSKSTAQSEREAPYDGPAAKLDPIMAGCAFMQHVRDDAATLPEQDWFIGVNIAANCENGIDHAHDLSKPYPGYTERETQKKAERASAQGKPHSCSAIAELAGSKWCDGCQHRGKIKSPIVLGLPNAGTTTSITRNDQNGTPPDEANDDPHRFAHSDLGNAERLIDQHRDSIRWCEQHRCWLAYNSTHWETGADRNVERKAQQTVRSLYAAAAAEPDERKRKEIARHALKSEQAQRITGAVQMARAQVLISPDDLDRDPWAFNVQNGTIDTRTGERRPHNPRDYITKLAPVRHDPKASAPTFGRFLASAFGGDADIIGYVQRFLGYCLTGDVREDALPIFYGSGMNGKSTLLDAIKAVLGPYAGTASPELLLTNRSDNRARDKEILELRGRRMVTTIETGDGRALNESIVKWITGGDKLRGRANYREAEEFAPTHKIIMATNHAPRVTGTDRGIWRRIHLVPFTQTFYLPNDPQRPPDIGADMIADESLPDKLAAEASGILNWMIEGCLEWQANGLQTPEKVQQATQEYRESEDVIGRFIEERCLIGRNYHVGRSDLYAAYLDWAKANGERELKHIDFSRRIGERGFSGSKANQTRIWEGLGLRVPGTVATNTVTTGGVEYDVF